MDVRYYCQLPLLDGIGVQARWELPPGPKQVSLMDLNAIPRKAPRPPKRAGEAPELPGMPRTPKGAEIRAEIAILEVKLLNAVHPITRAEIEKAIGFRVKQLQAVEGVLG